MDYRTLSDIFGRKFSIKILDTLYEEGEMRNKDLKMRLGSASDSLTDTLYLLKDKGLIERDEKNKARVYYSLTEDGYITVEKIREISEQIN